MTDTTSATLGNFADIDAIMDAHHRHGGFFFSPNTMRAFKSRVSDRLHAGHYFIVSDKRGDHNPRTYTIHVALSDGTIENVSPHGAYWSGTSAHRNAEMMAEVETLVPVEIVGENWRKWTCMQERSNGQACTMPVFASIGQFYTCSDHYVDAARFVLKSFTRD